MAIRGPSNNNPSKIILDSGASGNYFSKSSHHFYEDAKQKPNISVTTPNGSVIQSIFTAKLRNLQIPEEAREVFIFKDEDLPHFNLVSISKLTSAGIGVSFTHNSATAEDDDGKNILRAERDSETGLYCINTERKHAHVLFPKHATTDEKEKFHIATLGSPTTSTLSKALVNGWIKLPGITLTSIREHPHSEATSKGHLDRTRSGLDSTHARESTQPMNKTIYVDLTGRFPHKSTRGMEYIMISRCSESNFIHAETMKSRSQNDYNAAFERTIKFFRDHNIYHTHVKLDNETSATFKEMAKLMDIQIEYIPPDNHRQNPVERDIRTFKNHFIASLCTTDPDFPINEWDLLLPQVEMTLNLLRGSRRKPDISAYQHVIGKFDCERNPIAPMGTKVIVLDDPDNRSTWSPHGTRGYYIGPAMNHYRGYRILMEDTRRIRVSDSVAWHARTRDVSNFMDTYTPFIIDSSPIPSMPPLPPIERALKESEDEPENEQSQEIENSPEIPDQQECTEPESDTSDVTTQESIASRCHNSRKRQSNQRYTKDYVNYAGSAVSYKSACKGPDAKLWLKAANEEFDRLVNETQTMKFIPWSQKPKDRKASYYNPQVRVKVKSNGIKEYRVRGTYGGDISDYVGPTSAQTADMPSTKILLNDVVSDDADFMTIDIKDFYLGTRMKRKEYMRIHLSQIPIESQIKYITEELVHDGSVLVEISKGIYGLTQAGLLAQEQLFEHLSQNDFYPISPENPCIFKHKRRNITFCLFVDDFGVKYKLKEDAEHLINILNEKYKTKTDWTGTSFLGFKIERNHTKGTLKISMPNYVSEAAIRFSIDISKRIENPNASEKHEAEMSNHDSSPLTEQQRKRLQQIIGVTLYYARAIDSTVLTRISKLSTQQSKATYQTLIAAERVIKYLASQPEASITYHKSNMKLICYSDSSYQNESGSRSRCGGIFFLGTNDRTLINGPVLCKSSIIDVVTSSVAESEFGAAFMNAKEAVYLRNTLTALGYPQDRTTLITDNSFVYSIVRGTCKAKRSKAMDMRFYWLKDRVKRGQFNVLWCQGHRNIADYLTKDLPTLQHKVIRGFILNNQEKCRSIGELPSYRKVDSNICELEGVCSSETETSPEDTNLIPTITSSHA